MSPDNADAGKRVSESFFERLMASSAYADVSRRSAPSSFFFTSSLIFDRRSSRAFFIRSTASSSARTSREDRPDGLAGALFTSSSSALCLSISI